MRRSIRPRLASRLMLAQLLVVAVGAITPVIAATLLAPQLFHRHLLQAGVTSGEILYHAEAAFRSAMGIAVLLGVLMSIIAAGVVSWFLVRRIAAPIELLATATRAVSAGEYDVEVPTASFSSEIDELAASFTSMAARLSDAGATRTRMLADLAHEVRTPLATLQAYIDGIEDGVIAGDVAAWATMRTQVDRLRRLADDIRIVASAESQAMTLERMDGCDALRAAALAAAPRFRSKGVDLDLAICESPCLIHGDAVRLQQVLANLLDNAWRHTPTGGSVRMTAQKLATHCVIEVADTGEGIPVDQLTAVFERLHRVDASRASSDGGGSGLGLTIARAIVQAHGGTLTAYSAGPGTGARFTITIPLA